MDELQASQANFRAFVKRWGFERTHKHKPTFNMYIPGGKYHKCCYAECGSVEKISIRQFWTDQDFMVIYCRDTGDYLFSRVSQLEKLSRATKINHSFETAVRVARDRSQMVRIDLEAISKNQPNKPDASCHRVEPAELKLNKFNKSRYEFNLFCRKNGYIRHDHVKNAFSTDGGATWLTYSQSDGTGTLKAFNHHDICDGIVFLDKTDSKHYYASNANIKVGSLKRVSPDFKSEQHRVTVSKKDVTRFYCKS